jgi:predicted metal-dependent phosphoesterase TrpH
MAEDNFKEQEKDDDAPGDSEKFAIALENEKVDLHIHTVECDGAGMEEVITEAEKNMVRAILAADHHKTTAYDKLVNIAERRKSPVMIIPGIEISTLEGYHVLGMMIEPHDERLNRRMEDIIAGRQDRGMKIAKKLDGFFAENSIGIGVKFGDVMAITKNGNIAGGHFEKHIYEQFKAMAEDDTRRYVENMKRFIDVLNRSNPGANLVFDETWDINSPLCVAFIKESLVRRYLLRRGMPCHEKRTEKDCVHLEEAAELIDHAEGIKCLPHPGERNDDGALYGVLQRIGADALEVISSKHTDEQCRRYAHMAKELNLVVTGGTDWHGREFSPHITIGEVHYTTQDGKDVRPTYKMVQELRRRKEKKFGLNSPTF